MAAARLFLCKPFFGVIKERLINRTHSMCPYNYGDIFNPLFFLTSPPTPLQCGKGRIFGEMVL